MQQLQTSSFGALLRRRRLGLGLTQEALAERAGVSVRGISDLERGIASRPQRATLDALLDVLAVSGDERARLEALAGYRRSREAASDLPGSAPIPVVGRAPELAALRRHIAGEIPPVLLLTGEPGIGKSRLLQEAAALARRAGFMMLQGGAQRRSGQEPYAPLLDILVRSLDDLSPRHVRTALTGCGWLSRLLPELAEMSRVPLPVGAVPPEQERRLVFAAVARYLANIAGPAGTLLVLDDLQWASPDGLDLLASLLQRAGGTAVRVLGGYRDTEVGTDHPLSALLAELAEQGLVEQVSLDPLRGEDALALLNVLLEAQGRGDRPGVKEQILERAGGVPFFLVSCAQSLEFHDGRDGVPWTVVQSIQQRVASLPAGAQEVVHAAAILGRVMERSTLMATVDVPEGEVIAGLDAAGRARLLVPEGRATYRFAHDIIREAIESQLDPGTRMLLHRRAAEALTGRPEVRAAEMAWHALEGDLADRALPYVLQAGDEAEVIFAHAEAEGHYRQALDLARQLGNRQAQAEIQGKLAAVLSARARYDEALDYFEKALALSREVGNPASEAALVARIGLMHARKGSAQEGVTRVQSLLGELEARDPTSPLLVGLYSALTQLLGATLRFSDAVAAGERTMRLASAEGSPRGVMQAGTVYGTALLSAGRREEAARMLDEAIQRAEVLGDIGTLCVGLNNMAYTWLYAGAFRRVADLFRRGLAASRRAQAPDFVAMFTASVGCIEYLQGEWGVAQSHLEEAAGLARSIGACSMSSACLASLAELYLFVGRGEEAARCFDEAQALGGLHPAGPLKYACLPEPLAFHDLLEGRPAAALDRLQRYRAAPPGWDHPGFPLWLVAWAHLELGDERQAEELATRSASLAREQDNQLTLLYTQWVQGMIWRRQGRMVEAANAFAEALNRARSMPYPYMEGQILTSQAALYCADGRPRDAGEALERALAIFRRLGARPSA